MPAKPSRNAMAVSNARSQNIPRIPICALVSWSPWHSHVPAPDVPPLEQRSGQGYGEQHEQPEQQEVAP